MAMSLHTIGSEAVVIPLYRPTDRPSLSWGLRLSDPDSGTGFDYPDADRLDAIAHRLAVACNGQGVPFLGRVGNLAGFRDLVAASDVAVQEETGVGAHSEVLGYTELLLRNHQRAEDYLIRGCRMQSDDEPDWCRTSRRRCARILDLLRRDPAQARSELNTWATASARALGVARAGGGLGGW